MGLLFKNNAETTLSSGINNSTTTVPVASAAVFPTPDANNVFFATIDDGTNIEVVKVTAISSNDLTVVRAQDNTSASAFSTGANIQLRLTAKILEMGTSSLTDLDGDTKIQVEESSDEDKIRFDTGGTERMVITDAGRVGINNASPSRPVHIEMAGDATLLDRTGSAGGVLLFANGGTVKGNVGVQSGGFGLGGGFRDPDLFITTGGQIVAGGTNADPLGLTFTGKGLSINEDSGTAFMQIDSGNGSRIDFGVGGTRNFLIYSDATNYSEFKRTTNHPILFGTNNTERMRLLGGGGLQLAAGNNISNASGDFTLDVAGDITLDADGEHIRFKDGGVERGNIDLGSGNFTLRSTSSDSDIIFRGNDGGTDFTALTLDMSAAGAATFNDNVTAYSDERLKDNIETIENGLDKVEQLRGVTYTRDEKESIGVIAQEVEKILPEVVLTADDEMGTKSVDYSRLTAVLIEAVKDLSARVKELENK